jgi:hypothetical protein
MVAIVAMALLLIATRLNAQYTLGSTGLFNIPTADWQETGTFRAGANYLPESITPDRFDYNTGNYFLNLTFFSFVELTYRQTLLKSTYMSTKPKYQEQDRSYSIRFNLLKEGKIRPSLAIGTNDPVADEGANSFQSYYGVLTKVFHVSGNNQFSTSLGYYIPGGKNNQATYYGNHYDGLFAGVSYSPGFYRELKVIAEYDSHNFNVGAAVRLWKHLSVHAFANDFNSVSGGIRYECVLKH